MKKLRAVMVLLLVFVLTIPVSDTHAAIISYKLNTSTKTISGVGKKFTLKATAPSPYQTTWKSSNNSIATVSSKGVVTAQKKGTATISCTIKHGNITKKLTCKITVKVPAKAIYFTNAKIDEDLNAQIIELGNTYDFGSRRVSSSTKSASTDVIRYYVGDTTKATVDGKTGLFTPLKTGMTTLTVCAGATATKAKAPSNPVKQTINIYIKKPIIQISDCSLADSMDLKIVFNHPMNGSTLINADGSLSSNIGITANSGSSALGTLTGNLSEDKTTLTIHNTGVFDGSYLISLSASIASESGYPLTSYSEIKVLKDTEKPTYLGCTVDDSGMVVSMNFSEPVSIKNLRITNPKRSDGKSLMNPALFTTMSNYTLSEDKKSILLDLSSLPTIDQNISIQITLYGIVDLANNTTNPYPLTIQVYTNTTTQTQASLSNMYRNGNSLVAVFNKTMKVPGYAIVNSSVITGIVNPANKKEIIYHMTDSSLLSMKGNVTVTLNNYSTYNTDTTTTSVQQIVAFGAPAVFPTITESSLAEDVSSNRKSVLTLTYNCPVTLSSVSGQLNASSNLDGVISASTPYAYTASANGKTVTITFSNTFKELADYTFTIPAKFVTDCYYNENAAVSVTVTKSAVSTSEALPQPSGIQIGGANNEYIYVTFPNMLDTTTALDKSNYNISGLTILSASLLANNYNCPSIVKLQINPNNIESDVPYQVTISGIKGYKGSYTTMKKYQNMITLSNNKTLSVISKNAYSSTKTFVLSFGTALSTSSKISYTATVNNTELPIKSSIINGNTITITFENSLTAGSTIVLKPGNDNSIIDVNNQKMLNTAVSAIVA